MYFTNVLPNIYTLSIIVIKEQEKHGGWGMLWMRWGSGIDLIASCCLLIAKYKIMAFVTNLKWDI